MTVGADSLGAATAGPGGRAGSGRFSRDTAGSAEICSVTDGAARRKYWGPISKPASAAAATDPTRTGRCHFGRESLVTDAICPGAAEDSDEILPPVLGACARFVAIRNEFSSIAWRVLALGRLRS
jgi:hypothetical protein